MKQPESNMTHNSTLKTIIQHYEWMVHTGRVKMNGSAYNRLQTLRDQREAHSAVMRNKYGNSYKGLQDIS